MADHVRWGIISTAQIGKNSVIPGIKKSYNGVVAAVASRHLESAQSFANELNIPKAYGSYEELLADPDIDAIYNPLPNKMHAEWSIKCAEAGKPCLCEKPLASNAAEAQSIVDVFAERDVLLAEAFMYRFHPRTQQVKELIDSGAIGKITAIQSTFTFNIAGHPNDIRLNKSLAGGSLMDIGCYCVNVMRLMTGEEPEQVKALAQIGETGVDDSLVGILEFPSGALGHFDCSFHAPVTNTYEIRGPEGRIYVEPAFGPPPTSETTIRYWNDEGLKEIVIPPFDQYQLMVEDFANAILIPHHEPRFNPQDSVQNMAVIDKLYASLND